MCKVISGKPTKHDGLSVIVLFCVGICVGSYQLT